MRRLCTRIAKSAAACTHTLQVLLPRLPTFSSAVVALPPVGAGNLMLSAPEVACPLAACANFTWAVNCTVSPGGGQGPAFTRVGATAQATIGVGSGNAINLASLEAYSCTARQVVTDVLGRTATGPPAIFQVRAGV